MLIGRIAFGLTSAIFLMTPIGSPQPDAADVSGTIDVPALSASTFLNSLGINIHVAQGYPASHYIAPLKYIGVSNVRDSGDHLPGLLRLHEETGVKVDLLSWCRLDVEMTWARQLAAAGALLAIEGPNEPNNFSITYDGKKGGRSDGWLPVAQCQEALFKATKTDDALKSYPVFSVSEGGAEPTNVGLQYLTIPKDAGTEMPDGTQFADYANVHNYVSSTTRSLYEDNQAWQAADPTLDDSWDGLYGEYGRTWLRGFKGYSEAQLKTLPRVTTETGWDSKSDPGGESVQGKVLVNTYLAQFKRGWNHTFIYELIDGEGSQGEQGIYTAHYAPKLAATYIHNLTTILADKNPIADIGRLNYSIIGQPDTVHDLLLQKSNGAYELVVWGEQVRQSANLVVRFGQLHKTVNLYDVTAKAEPMQTYSGANLVPLVVSDQAMIIEVID